MLVPGTVHSLKQLTELGSGTCATLSRMHGPGLTLSMEEVGSARGGRIVAQDTESLVLGLWLS